jgi:hypothetical protein
MIRSDVSGDGYSGLRPLTTNDLRLRALTGAE